MISSPPQEAEQIRGKTLTPESPKPVHYPSPANIPILEKQMDPMFHMNEPALGTGTPASYPPYQQPQTQTPSAQSTTTLYADPQAAPSYQNAGAQGSVGTAPAGYPQSTAYGGGFGAQSQDTSSIHNYPSQPQASASSFSEANPAQHQDNRPAYHSSYDPNAYAAQQSQAQPSHGGQYQPQADTVNTAIYQALVDSLSPTAENSASDRYAASSLHSQSSQLQGQAPVSSLPAAPNLPPRPPPQDKSATHAHFNPNDDIRSYHPHSQKPGNNQFRPPGQLHLSNLRGSGPNLSVDIQPGTRSNQSPSSPGYGQRQSVDRRSATPDDEDIRWPAEINKLYEEFLEDERKYVTDGQWDQFPMGSRLFIGNLPTEKVTKRDIFHRFFRHGKLAQISIKQAYGFVQFLDASSCHKALQAEQGQSVRGRKMHLEISKPQRNTKKGDGGNNDRNNGARRRSRSPDYTRGGTGSHPRNVDRYVSNQNVMSPRDRDSRRYRDEYRRSPSPPRGGRGNRGRERSRDRYDGRRRSRSRTPRRYRSPSPRRDSDDELPLPFRSPQDIPDIQVLVVNEGLPRDYIRWVEDSFRQQGLRIDVLILSPRLSEAAVVRRQIVEGVLAIVKLNTSTLSKGKVNLQVFDRRSGLDNVKFDEYVDLDPATAAALVINVKQTQSQPAQPPQAPAPQTYSYGLPPATATPYANAVPQANPYSNIAAAAANPANLSSLISALDPNGLSQLLGAMAQKPPSQLQAANPVPDLAQLLQSISAPQPQPAYNPGAQAPPQNYQNPLQNATLASLLGGQAPPQPTAAPPVQTPAQVSPTGQPDMNEIMAQLAKYQR